MADIDKKINIEVITKIDKATKDFAKLTRVSNDLNAVGLQLSKSGKYFTDVNNKQRVSFEKGVKRLNEYQTSVKKNTKSVHEGTKAFKDFTKASAVLSTTLPLMFGFQSISQGMESLIDPAMNLLGVTDLYNTFLAMKYLPTAEEQLDNVLNMGEAWLDESESQRKTEGDLVLFNKQLSDAITYSAQLAMMGNAVGGVIGGIAGAAIGAGTSIAVMGNETLRTVEYFSGFNAAVGMGATDALASLSNLLGLSSSNMDDSKVSIDATTKSTEDLTTAINNVPPEKTVEITIDVKNKEQLTNLIALLGERQPTSVSEMISSTSSMPAGGLPLIKPSEVGSLKPGSSGFVPGTGVVTAEKTVFQKMIEAGTKGATEIKRGTFDSPIAKLLGFAEGGIVPGPEGRATPAVVHGGETIIPNGKSSGNVTLNAYYNINVSDKLEMQRIIDSNNKKLVEDFKRRIAISS